jgi:hypothetical protein
VITPQRRNGAHGAGKEVVLQLLLPALLGQCPLARFGLFAPCMQFVADVAQVLQGLGAWLAGHGSGVGNTGTEAGRYPLRVARIKELFQSRASRLAASGRTLTCSSMLCWFALLMPVASKIEGKKQRRKRQ